MVRHQLTSRGIHDARVLATMAALPRERFVPTESNEEAYEDHPVRLTDHATVSQPFVQAWMTQALALRGTEKVLEVGTGSGYQTAILAELCGSVYSIELDPELARNARDRLLALGYYNVHVRQGDGCLGWFDEAPFDAILLTGAPEAVPRVLFEQLQPDGRLVAPVGEEGDQRLFVYRREGRQWISKDLGGVRFVPLRRSL